MVSKPLDARLGGFESKFGAHNSTQVKSSARRGQCTALTVLANPLTLRTVLTV